MTTPKDPTASQQVVRKRLLIRNHQGLHARPAALFVRVAKQFKAAVWVKKGRRRVDGKSIMGLLTLAAEKGSSVELIAEGPDAVEAIRSLEQLVSHQELPAVVDLIRHGTGHGPSASSKAGDSE